MHGRDVVTIIVKPIEDTTLGAVITGVRLADLEAANWDQRTNYASIPIYSWASR